MSWEAKIYGQLGDLPWKVLLYSAVYSKTGSTVFSSVLHPKYLIPQISISEKRPTHHQDHALYMSGLYADFPLYCSPLYLQHYMFKFTEQLSYVLGLTWRDGDIDWHAVEMFSRLAAKALGVGTVILQYGCIAHCTFEFVGDFVVVGWYIVQYSRPCDLRPLHFKTSIKVLPSSDWHQSCIFSINIPPF